MNGTNLNRLLHLAALLGAVALIAQAQAGDLLLEVDDFEVDREGWGIVGEVVTTGGPAGAGDGYFAYESNGFGGPGSRMVIPNEAPGNQWQGDYLTEGVTGFEMDVLNNGASQLDLRIAIANGSTWWVSTDPVVIAPGSSWTSVAFQIAEDAMTNLGADDFDTVAADVQRIRILSSVGLPDVAVQGGVRGDLIEASIGVDNIRAVGVPEPTSAVALLLGVVAALGRRRV